MRGIMRERESKEREMRGKIEKERELREREMRGINREKEGRERE